MNPAIASAQDTDIVCRGMNRAQLDAAYDNRAQVGNWAAILDRWQQASARLYATKRVMRGIPYGSHKRQVMDMFFADEPGRPTLVYFHGGYWQWLDKHEEAFVVEGPLSRGFNVVLCDYRLCPSVALAEIAQDASLAMDVLIPQLAGLGAHPASVIVAGSSAGAHLAATLLGKAVVKGALLISGLCDLTPIAASSLNTVLGLDAAGAYECSPIFQVKETGPSVCFAVGSRELPDLRWQTEAYHDAWRRRGHSGWLETIAGANHFTIMDDLALPDGLLVNALLRLSNMSGPA